MFWQILALAAFAVLGAWAIQCAVWRGNNTYQMWRFTTQYVGVNWLVCRRPLSSEKDEGPFDTREKEDPVSFSRLQARIGFWGLFLGRGLILVDMIHLDQVPHEKRAATCRLLTKNKQGHWGPYRSYRLLARFLEEAGTPGKGEHFKPTLIGDPASGVSRASIEAAVAEASGLIDQAELQAEVESVRAEAGETHFSLPPIPLPPRSRIRG